MKWWQRVLLVLVVMQAGVFMVYAGRTAPPPPAGFAIQTLTTRQPAPPLVLERRSGEQVTAPAGRWRLVHFWATWCPPCKRELPGVLALTRASTTLEVLPIALEEWSDLDGFFAGTAPPEVVRLIEHDALDRYGVSTLPDSYLVSPAGVLVARIAGERDWTQAAPALAAVMEAHAATR